MNELDMSTVVELGAYVCEERLQIHAASAAFTSRLFVKIDMPSGEWCEAKERNISGSDIIQFSEVPLAGACISCAASRPPSMQPSLR